MNENEVNKIIAEFMNLEIEVAKNGCVLTPTNARFWHPVKYCDSLDSLVPVWEKLNVPRIYEIDIKNGSYSFCVRYYANLAYQENTTAPTIQQAAAHATAKVILKLEE